MVTLDDNEKWRLEIISALRVFYYYLSWSEKDLMLGILHPGGGQYHCLTIMDDSKVLLHMNKFASATTFFPASFSVTDFGGKAMRNPEKVAQSLFSGSIMNHTYGVVNSARAAKMKMIAHMLGLLEELQGNRVELLWGFFDSSSEGAYSNFETVPKEFPPVWTKVSPVNTLFYDWAANILQIESNGEVIATYNQQTGQLLRSSGELVQF